MSIPPKLTAVKSSNIDAVGHDHRGLVVRFKGGATYAYPAAKKELYTEMMAADSVGKFFAANVRNLPSKRLDA